MILLSEMQKQKKIGQGNAGVRRKILGSAGGDDADDEVVICFCHRA
jgi:hypothetical protein